MFLSETRNESWFCVTPSSSQSSFGEVVNFNDYFHIKGLESNFYFHVFKKPYDEFDDFKTFALNASQDASKMRAKLFMSYNNSEKEKSFVQSGDVIRLRHYEADGYLTISNTMTDMIIPPMADYLKGQIRRMTRNEEVEKPKGGKDKE